MTYGKSTETIVGKALGGRNHIRYFSVPHQARRMLHLMRLAGARNHCYSCNWRRDLEDRRNRKDSGDQPKTGFIRDVIRLIKESIALSLEESDEYDDFYDELRKGGMIKS